MHHVDSRCNASSLRIYSPWPGFLLCDFGMSIQIQVQKPLCYSLQSPRLSSILCTTVPLSPTPHPHSVPYPFLSLNPISILFPTFFFLSSPSSPAHTRLQHLSSLSLSGIHFVPGLRRIIDHHLLTGNSHLQTFASHCIGINTRTTRALEVYIDKR